MTTPKPTLADVKRWTDTFFERHWAEADGRPPMWSEPWQLEGTSPITSSQGATS